MDRLEDEGYVLMDDHKVINVISVTQFFIVYNSEYQKYCCKACFYAD
jgi:hypothetical protein